MNNGTLGGFGRAPQKVAATPLQTPTVMTSGTGVFKPKPGTQWLRVRKWGGGGGSGNGGSSPGTYGIVQPGGRGQYTEEWVKNTLSSYTWQVGAGGVASTNGGNTTFTNTMTAQGGKASSGPTGNPQGTTPPLATEVGPGAGGMGGAAYNGVGFSGYPGNDGLIIVEEY
jgi:hypothetical protein